MKARVKATGEIVEVIATGDYVGDNNQIVGEYKANDGGFYTSYDLDFYVDDNILTPDYWERLKHRYAGMAMRSLIMRDCSIDDIVSISDEIATALVEKMKQNNNNQ